MGRGSGREAACYFMSDLTKPRLTRPDQSNHLHPEPASELFIVKPLPPQWAVYSDKFREGYFPICTWGDCSDKTIFTNNDDIHGNPLMYTSLESIELAEYIILYHLKHIHHVRTKNIVTPFEPYATIFVIKHPIPVWE